MGVANYGVPTLKLPWSVFSDFLRSREMMANLCFPFTSSFRYVEFQVMCKICQPGHSGQTTKKTRTTQTQGSRSGAAECAVTPGTLTHKRFFKISPKRTEEFSVSPECPERAVSSPQGLRRTKSPVAARPSLDLSEKFSPDRR